MNSARASLYIPARSSRANLAANWYMAPTTASPAGNDSNAGTSRAAPFATFFKANSVVSAGQTVAVAPGNYPVPATGIKLTTNGSSGNPITYRADNIPSVLGGMGAASRITPSAGFTAMSGDNILVGLGDNNTGGSAVGNWIIFDGFEVDGQLNTGPSMPGTPPANGIVLMGSNDIVRNCYVHDMYGPDTSKGGAGILAQGYYGGGSHIIEQCVVYKCWGASLASGVSGPDIMQGIYFAGYGAANCLIQNNLVVGIARDCITTYHSCTGFKVVNNTCIAGNVGITVATASGGGINTNARVFNNIVAHCADTAIVENNDSGNADSVSLAGCLYDHNLLFSNGANSALLAGHVLTNTLTANSPVNFKNDTQTIAGNYRLVSSAVAAYRAGISSFSSVSAPSLDIQGRSRGAFWDLGAYKF